MCIPRKKGTVNRKGYRMEAANITSTLNQNQAEAVLQTEGPVLILAGAGSGKTRVLVHRISYLIEEIGVNPCNILAITFTNKAAGEMRDRVDQMVGFGAGEVRVSTFHSLCVRILRRNADLLGYTRYFTIYDTDDQLTLMKQIFKQKNVDSKKIKEKAVLGAISSAKDELVGPDAYQRLNKDWWGQQIGEFYEAYQEQLKANNAMDFDDLIMKTVELFEEHPDVLQYYQELFQYVMVDEYQDTNTAQFRFVSLIAEKYRNLCVVGDDDQSIYKFRGANIRNILNFEKIFPDARVIKLEQNYRSTKQILNAANEVIRHNTGRKEKSLWTENPDGDKIRLRRFANGFEEAEFITGEISRMVRTGKRKYQDFAILYRTNAQSRLFEEKFLYANLPYKIVGGVNFYARKEIKDLLAYLKTISNGVDDLAVRRIINIPKRGIGQTTIGRIADYAEMGGISFFDAACAAKDVPGVSGRARKQLDQFTDFIAVMRAKEETLSVSGLLKEVIDATGYVEELKANDDEESQARIENIDELVSKAAQYEESAGTEASLQGFLEEVALIADIDTVDDDDDRVLLMTLHSAKGLEFPVVYMAGMEEGLFPSSMSINADNPQEEIEEERRLCYVGITRARESLTLTCARERMVRGDIVSSPLSRFVREIPKEMVDLGYDDSEHAKPAFGKEFPLHGGFDGGLKDAFTQEAYAPKPSSGRSTYAKKPAKQPDYHNPYTTAPSTAPSKITKSGDLGYTVGDTVHHVKFGDGVVKDIQNGARDYQVTVDFPAWGIKKMFASFAKLKKKN